MAESNARPTPVPPPGGIYQARVDEKGRLKLPADFHAYLSSLGEERFFITTFDLRMARLYPNSLWKETEKFLEEEKEDAGDAEDLAFVAKDLGKDAELDSQGRVLVPTELRRLLKIEGQPVWLDHYKGRVNVYGKEIYEERKQRALTGLEGKLKKLERKGLR